MAAHDPTFSLNYGGTWNILNDGTELLEGPGIKTVRGYATEGTIRPSEITARLRDDAHRYDPDNASSDLYGLLTRRMLVAAACDGVYDSVGEAASFTPDQTPDYVAGPPQRGYGWTDLKAAGVLRRIGQWSKTLQSPMRQWIGGYTNLRGYWPLEDGKNATQLTNAAPNGAAGYVTRGITFAAADGPAGSDSVIEVAAGAVWGGNIRSMSSTAGYQLAWVCDFTDATLTAAQQPMITWKTANGLTYTWNVSTGSYAMRVQRADGTYIIDNATLFGTGAEPQHWIAFRIKVSQVAGNVQLEIAWYPQDSSVLYGVTHTFAGSVSRPTSWKGGAIDKQHMGHLLFLAGTTDNLQSYSYYAAFDGYNGERAADRFSRLCSQEGIPYVIMGTASDTQLMGRQRVATFMDHLKEIASTDDCLIFDRKDNNGVVLRTRRDLYNLTPDLALTWPTDIGQPFRKVVDDLGISNVVTVKQLDGGEATARLDGGLLGADEIGEEKTDINVNVFSEADLEGLAGYWLNRLSVPGARFPSVVIDCDASPALATAAGNVEVGDLLTITGYTPYLIRLMVIGIETSTNARRRVITYTTVPAEIFATIGVYDATTSRYDSDTTTLAEDITLTETIWDITSGDVSWSTADLPYDWTVDGETVRVTAMTAPVGTDPGPYTQQATVTRGINGVQKTHLLGAQIRLADPVRWGR